MKSFFIFGATVSKQYDVNGFKAAKKYIQDKYPCELFEYEPGLTDPSDLLTRYDGWSAFAEITEKEYNELVKIKKEKAV